MLCVGRPFGARRQVAVSIPSSLKVLLNRQEEFQPAAVQNPRPPRSLPGSASHIRRSLPASWSSSAAPSCRELTNVGGAWKGIQCCVLLFRRSVTHRFSQFIKCQNSMGNTQVICFLILYAEDVDPDKVLRRYHGLDFEVNGFVKLLPQFGMRRCVYAIFMHPQIQSEHHLGYILVVSTEMQYVLYQRKIESRTRSMSHLLSSVDPVLYCDTNGPTHAPTVFFACFIGCFSVCGLCTALSCFTEWRIHCLCTTAAAVWLFASVIMLYSVL